MKNFKLFIVAFAASLLVMAGCEDKQRGNTSAKQEQQHTEANQKRLNKNQPPPDITWSLERYNLTRRTLLQNDRSVQMYLYLFNQYNTLPIGFFIIDKVSSVNSQLTNPQQLVYQEEYQAQDHYVMDSPAEDGSYGTNGDAVFGFTDFEGYIETNMSYVTTTWLIPAWADAAKLGTISPEDKQRLEGEMQKINAAAESK